MAAKGLMLLFTGVFLLMISSVPLNSQREPVSQDRTDSLEKEELLKFRDALNESRVKIKELDLKRTDKIFDNELGKVKEALVENKHLREEMLAKPDTIKVIVRDTVYITKKDTMVKRTWLDKIINN